MNKILAFLTGLLATGLLILGVSLASEGEAPPSAGTPCKEAGPQSPRDIDRPAGTNPVDFAWAPPAAEMNLCNVHFHKFAEHKAAAYSVRMGTGDQAGFACAGHAPQEPGVGEDSPEEGPGCRAVAVGDTIEVHWVFTTCNVKPGPGLESCGSCPNQRLRVETAIFYLTGEGGVGLDFAPPATAAVRYKGSTTGPKFNDENCSPAQVTWNVRRDCSPLRLASLNHWCENEGKNVYKEDHGHGVRRLVEREALLSPIEP